MTVTYQVGGGGHLDIDFWVTSPFQLVSLTQFKLTPPVVRRPERPAPNLQKKRDTGMHLFNSFIAEDDGRYLYCFFNELSTATGKTV